MDNKKQSIHYKKCLFRESKDHQLETQLNLPDYYPDVCRILSCKVQTYTEHYYADGDRITADGIAVIRLLYCSEDKSMHLFETEQRFSKCVVAQNNIQSPVLRCEYKTESIHYRAIGPRRVDIKAAVKLSVAVSVVSELNCFASDTDGIESLVNEYELFDISSCYCDLFVINEDFSPRDERIKNSKILNSSVNICTTEIKSVRDKILIKGNVELNLIYLCQQEQILFKYTESVPFSQIIDLYGIRESDRICLQLKPQQPVLSIKDSGECELSLCVMADICSGDIKTAYMTADLFGSKCEVAAHHETESFQKNARVFKDTFSASSDNEKTEYTDLQILACFASEPVSNIVFQQERLTVNGQMQICIIAESDGEIVCFSRNVLFEYNRETDLSSETDCILNVTCKSVSCNKMSGGLQIKAELELDGYSLFNESISFVADCEINPSSEVRPFETVTLYYAEIGESIWDIAKQNKVSIHSLKMTNDLTGEYIDEEKVLILLHSEAAI